MDTLYKTIRAELKDLDEDGSLNMLIPVSTASMDRDGEVIEPTAFRKTIPKFMKHPVLVASHDYRDLTNQIGEWTKLKITEMGIEGKPKYYIGLGNEQADWAYKLAQKGVAAFSIGFIPKEWEDGDGVKSPRRTYKEVELLEISQVIIPSNREAIQNIRSKSVDPIITKLCDEVEGELEIEGVPEIVKEVITKPEETDEIIRIPVRTCEVTATIDISKREGISALYCGKEKLVRTYLFRKDKGWNLEKAKAWVKEHEGKAFEPDDAKGIEVDKVSKSVIPYHKYPLDETGDWDAAREVRDADVDDLKKICAIVVGDPDNKTSYKLPHHRADGYSTVWRAVANCAAVLMGARGGVDAPEADIAGARVHIAKHYADFSKGEPPWGKSVSQATIIDEIDYLKAIIANGLNDDARKAFSSLVESVGGGVIKMDMGKMQEMHDMMASCETMAKKSKKMAEDMMSENGDLEDTDDRKRSPGYEKPVEVKNDIDSFNIDDILKEISKIKLGG